MVNLLLQRAASPTEQDNGPLLNEAQAQIGELVHYIRNLSLDLRPTMLDDLGLLDTLIWYLGRYSANTKVQVAFKHYGLGRPMEPQIATTVYRVVQEALTNVARHAGVDHAILRVWAARHAVYLQVEDNGTGFDPSALAAGNSCGITGMRERVALVGGNLSVESTPGAGTCVTAEIPLEKVDDGHKET